MTVQDILDRRNTQIPGGNSLRTLELYGKQFVELHFVEPDPNTAHSEYYYNTRSNCLFKRLNIGTKSVWKRVN